MTMEIRGVFTSGPRTHHTTWSGCAFIDLDALVSLLCKGSRNGESSSREPATRWKPTKTSGAANSHERGSLPRHWPLCMVASASRGWPPNPQSNTFFKGYADDDFEAMSCDIGYTTLYDGNSWRIPGLSPGFEEIHPIPHLAIDRCRDVCRCVNLCLACAEPIRVGRIVSLRGRSSGEHRLALRDEQGWRGIDNGNYVTSFVCGSFGL